MLFNFCMLLNFLFICVCVFLYDFILKLNKIKKTKGVCVGAEGMEIGVRGGQQGGQSPLRSAGKAL